MKRVLDSLNGSGQPYRKRIREDLDREPVNAFAEMTATARKYYASLKGLPVIEKLNNNEESIDCSPLAPYRVQATQSTLNDFGFRQTYEKRVRPPDSH
nr:expressed protein [Hymenolepis microstoma]